MSKVSEPVKHRFFAAVDDARVDAEAGIIRGVSIITQGVARGHNVLIDQTTLRQMRSCLDAVEGGVKVKLEHYTGIEAIVGLLKNFKRRGKKLTADLCLLKKHAKFEWVLEMASEMPEAFGLSAVFRGEDEEKDGLAYARCEEVLSVDLVDRPAANPDGLFSEPDPERGDTSGKDDDGTDQPNHSMSDKKPADKPAPTPEPTVSPEVKALSDKLEALTNLVEKALPQPERKLSDMSETELKTLIATETAKGLSAVGLKPGDAPAPNPGTAPQPKPEPKTITFDEVVRTHKADGKSEAEAIRLGIKTHPDEYKAWREGLDPKTGQPRFASVA